MSNAIGSNKPSFRLCKRIPEIRLTALELMRSAVSGAVEVPIKPPNITEMDLIRARQLVRALTPLKRLSCDDAEIVARAIAGSSQRVASAVWTSRSSTCKPERSSPFFIGIESIARRIALRSMTCDQGTTFVGFDKFNFSFNFSWAPAHRCSADASPSMGKRFGPRSTGLTELRVLMSPRDRAKRRRVLVAIIGPAPNKRTASGSCAGDTWATGRLR